MPSLPGQQAFSIACPHCHAVLDCSAAMAGRLVACPCCGQQFQIASNVTPPPVAPPICNQIKHPNPFASLNLGASEGAGDPVFTLKIRDLLSRTKPGMTRQRVFLTGIAGAFLAILALVTTGFLLQGPSGNRSILGPLEPILASLILTALLLVYAVPSVV